MKPFYLCFRLEKIKYFLFKKTYLSDKILVDKDEMRLIRRAVRIQNNPYMVPNSIYFGKKSSEDALFFIFQHTPTSTESVEIRDETIMKSIQNLFDGLYNEEYNFSLLIDTDPCWKIEKGVYFSMHFEPVSTR